MRPTHRTLAGCLSVVAALALAGCASTPAGTGAVPPPQADQTRPPKVEAIAFGISALGAENNRAHLVCCTNFLQLAPMYEFLMGVDPNGKEMTPQLATEWSLGSDAKSYRFKLRPGVPFQNGFGSVTAQDVRYTWETMKGETEIFPPQPTQVSRQTIQDVEIVSDLELVIRLDQSNSGILSAIGQAESVFPIRSKADGQARSQPPTLLDKPLAGTGPFQYESREQARFVRYSRVAGTHWRRTPDAKTLELRIFKEPSTMLAALLAKEIQLAALPPDLTDQAKTSGSKLIAGKAPGLHAFMSFQGVYINKRIRVEEALNPDASQAFVFPNSPLMNVKVRKALSRAINRDDLNKAFLKGKGEPMYLEFFHPSRPGWNPDWEKRFKDEYGYNLEAAKQLLAEAGYGPSSPATITVQLRPYGYFPAANDMNEGIANYWRAAGVNVKIEQADAATFTSKGRQLAYDSHAYLIPTSIRQWLGPDIYNSLIGGNRGGVQLPELDDIYKEIKATLDPKRYEELWRKWGDLAYQQYVTAPLFYIPSEVAADPSVVVDYPFPGSISSTYTHTEYITLAR